MRRVVSIGLIRNNYQSQLRSYEYEFIYVLVVKIPKAPSYQ